MASIYLDYALLDVFTSEPYSGNPLAVVLVPKTASEYAMSQEQKQRIAREFNLPATIFVHTEEPQPGQRRVDIFTSKAELPFAGHPIIGATHFLLRFNKPGSVDVREILTKSGPIPVSLLPPTAESGSPLVKAQVAHNVRLHQKEFPLRELLRLHGSLAEFFPHSNTSFPVFSIVKGVAQVHVELPSEEALAAVAIASGGESIPGNDTYLDQGWTARHLVMYFYVRDVDDSKLCRKVVRTRLMVAAEEDPATGSAACGLAAYMMLTSQTPGQRSFDIVQGVEMGRRSEIGVDIDLGDGGQIASVALFGKAVEVGSGRILAPSPSL